ncbi:MAG: bifunctional 4-hydroxy-2-oxoglutarate aldolase/2-dehydro-3-deoxy-phosphogluconate aldolase [Phycisphaerae bacterium]
MVHADWISQIPEAKQQLRAATAATIRDQCVSAIIRTDTREKAESAMNAAVRGGFTLVEFTMTTPGALDLIHEFSKREGILAGAGTVMSVSAAEEAIAAGASFIVSPIFDPAVVIAAGTRGAITIPGASTPTEMETAYRGGADLVKVFPAPAGGVGFIEAVRGPMPYLPLFPTAGVDAENFTDFLDAGCVGAGFVKSLFVPADLEDGNYEAIEGRALRITQRLAAWKGR